jgi:FKBP-type peptidyl-prolyl cis-trans isomerase FkpA
MNTNNTKKMPGMKRYRNLINNVKWLSLPALALMIILIGPSCSPSSEYPGFNRSRGGIHYKLKVIGEGQASPRPGDYITIDINYSTLHDSMFFSARRKFQLEKPSYRGSVEECFIMLNTGDEADFIINAAGFFNKTLGIDTPAFLNSNEDFKISVAMLDIQTEQSYFREKEAFLSWIENFGEYEKIKLRHFIQEEQLSAEADSSGLYYIPLNETVGKKVEKGDTIEVHYEGKFLYGKFFDSTRKRDETFQFVYGQEWQVVEGLERAIGQMRDGQKALVILPSELAFGEYGSSTGIIPPYTSLVFEVEILSVR